MRENEPVLLVLSVCDGKIILEKGEILYEKCHLNPGDVALITTLVSPIGEMIPQSCGFASDLRRLTS